MKGKKKMKRKFFIGFVPLIFSVMVLLLSCSTTKTEDKFIMEYVHKNFKDMDKKKENCVFIIGSNGCLSCNIGMSNIATQFLDRQDTYFIIGAKENIVDISPYWEAKNQKQIVYDTANYFSTNNLPSSYAIFINNNKVDTILDADGRTFFANRDYIINRLTNKK